MGLRKAILTSSTNYNISPLQYPIKDVELVEKALIKRCRFNHNDISKILYTNSNKKTFAEELTDICNQLERQKKDKYDLIIFYYSGHGLFRHTENVSFLQVADDEVVSFLEIMEKITSIDAKNKYIIIDACQSGGYSLMQRKGKVERQFSYNSEGIYCMFGTTKDLLAFEPTIQDVIKRSIKNSFYSHFIVEALNTKSIYNENTVSIKIVDDYASQKTAKYTQFEQIPVSTTQTTGYFPFGFWDEKSDLDDINDWDEKEITEVTPELLSREVNLVEHLSDKIKNFFINDSKTPYYWLNNIDKDDISKLSQPALDILNKELDLVNKKYSGKPLINGLISAIATGDTSKLQFLIFILEQNEISINISLKDEDGNTALQAALQILEDHYYSSYIIKLLFSRNYYLNLEEEYFLNTEFLKKTIHPKLKENIALSLVCNKLKENGIDFISRIGKIEKIIFSLLSLKYKEIIGYRFANQTALANNFLNSYQEYSTLFFRAVKVYGYSKEFQEKPSIMKKVKEIQGLMPFQDSSYDEIFMAIFPELYNL